MDPRTYFAAQDAAYALPAASPGQIDTILGDDLNGPNPYGIVMQDSAGVQTVAFHGTEDGPEWIEDFDAEPVETVWGTVARGLRLTLTTLRTASGVPLSTYNRARVCGHSRGANLAAAWAVLMSSPEYALFAYPRLCGMNIVARLIPLAGMTYQMNLDLVPLLLPIYPELAQVTHLELPAGIPFLDIAAHHRFATYKAAINALYP